MFQFPSLIIILSKDWVESEYQIISNLSFFWLIVVLDWNHQFGSTDVLFYQLVAIFDLIEGHFKIETENSFQVKK